MGAAESVGVPSPADAAARLAAQDGAAFTARLRRTYAALHRSELQHRRKMGTWVSTERRRPETIGDAVFREELVLQLLPAAPDPFVAALSQACRSAALKHGVGFDDILCGLAVLRHGDAAEQRGLAFWICDNRRQGRVTRERLRSVVKWVSADGRADSTPLPGDDGVTDGAVIDQKLLCAWFSRNEHSPLVAWLRHAGETVRRSLPSHPPAAVSAGRTLSELHGLDVQPVSALEQARRDLEVAGVLQTAASDGQIADAVAAVAVRAELQRRILGLVDADSSLEGYRAAAFLAIVAACVGGGSDAERVDFCFRCFASPPDASAPSDAAAADPTAPAVTAGDAAAAVPRIGLDGLRALLCALSAVSTLCCQESADPGGLAVHGLRQRMELMQVPPQLSTAKLSQRQFRDWAAAEGAAIVLAAFVLPHTELAPSPATPDDDPVPVPSLPPQWSPPSSLTQLHLTDGACSDCYYPLADGSKSPQPASCVVVRGVGGGADSEPAVLILLPTGEMRTIPYEWVLRLTPGCAPLSGRVGMQNLANTCYMNSALQCLSHCRLLRDYFLHQEYRYHCNTSNNVMGQQGRVAVVFAQLMERLHCAREPWITPRAFKGFMAKTWQQFRGFQQHDAQEFLQLLLGGLIEDTNCAEMPGGRKPYHEFRDDQVWRTDRDICDENWAWTWLREETPVHAIFAGQEHHERKCLACGTRYRKGDFCATRVESMPSCDKRCVTIRVHKLRRKPQEPEYFRCTLQIRKQIDTHRDIARRVLELMFPPPAETWQCHCADTVHCATRESCDVCKQTRPGRAHSLQQSIVFAQTRGRHCINGVCDMTLPPSDNGDDEMVAFQQPALLRCVTPSQCVGDDWGVALQFMHRKVQECAHPFMGRRASLFGHPMLLTVSGRPRIVVADRPGPAASQEDVLDWFYKHLGWDDRLASCVVRALLAEPADGQRLHELMQDPATAVMRMKMLGTLEQYDSLEDVLRDLLGLEPGQGTIRWSDIHREAWQRFRVLCPGYTGDRPPYRLSAVSRDGRSCRKCHWLSGCLGCPIENSDEPAECWWLDSIACDWDEDVLQHYSAEAAESFVDLNSGDELREKAARERCANLEDLLARNTEAQENADSEQSHCRVCSRRKDTYTETRQTHRRRLYRLPPVLIMQLNRGVGMAHKNQMMIHFPLEGLDMAPYVAPDDETAPKPEPVEGAMMLVTLPPSCAADIGWATVRQVSDAGMRLEFAGPAGEAAGGQAAVTVDISRQQWDETALHSYWEPPTPESDMPMRPPPSADRMRQEEAELRRERDILQRGFVRLASRPGQGSTVYDVFAVVNHQGETLRDGHYYSYVKCKDGQWYEFNDKLVARIEDPACVCTREAYLLFLLRRDMADARIETLFPRQGSSLAEGGDAPVDIDIVLGVQVHTGGRNGTLFKRVYESGESGDRVFAEAMSITFTATADGEVFHTQDTPVTVYPGRHEIPLGLEQGLSTMRRGEECVLVLRDRSLAMPVAGHHPVHPPPPEGAKQVKYRVHCIGVKNAADVSEANDGSVLKRVLRPAPPGARVPECDAVAQYAMQIRTPATTLQVSEEQHQLGEGVLHESIEMALLSMAEGEESEFLIGASASQDWDDAVIDEVPTHKIRLISLTQSEPAHALTPAQRLERGQTLHMSALAMLNGQNVPQSRRLAERRFLATVHIVAHSSPDIAECDGETRLQLIEQAALTRYHLSQCAMHRISQAAALRGASQSRSEINRMVDDCIALCDISVNELEPLVATRRRALAVFLCAALMVRRGAALAAAVRHGEAEAELSAAQDLLKGTAVRVRGILSDALQEFEAVWNEIVSRRTFPDAIRITSPNHPQFCGTYTRLHYQNQGMPVWGFRDNRLFSTNQQRWMIGFQSYVARNMGFHMSEDHMGLSPQSSCIKWEFWRSREGWNDDMVLTIEVADARQDDSSDDDSELLFRSGLYEGKDSEGKWWPITLTKQNSDGTYAARVHREGGNDFLWQRVLKANVRIQRSARDADATLMPADDSTFNSDASDGADYASADS
eukprot:TRINITY_DN518_c0_g2_i1.p1 TRINITY_DN518_c0_g2~~TRINITY_DN518_c0_g2_i1.p1  ORF type:complete len:2026 (+),score=546.13 TRINITY_DN518_c0_g2_i1:130-6207(+)